MGRVAIASWGKCEPLRRPVFLVLIPVRHGFRIHLLAQGVDLRLCRVRGPVGYLLHPDYGSRRMKKFLRGFFDLVLFAVLGFMLWAAINHWFIPEGWDH